VGKPSFLVQFGAFEQIDSGTHRIRNWAEDLSREVAGSGWGRVENPETATNKVWVVASSACVVGELRRAVRRSLKRHKLFEKAAVRKG
jgi:hypothetical protein